MPDAPISNLPAVRAVRPPYIEAFEKFTQGKSDRIEALVAFGLFISSDYSWAKQQPTWPPEDLTRNMYSRLLHDDEVQKTESRAHEILEEHRSDIVLDHEKKYLKNLFDGVEQRINNMVATHSLKHFWKGVSEATTGAFVWTIILTAIAFGFYLGGIDVLHFLEGMPRR
jgi:hypothetical protein